MSSLDKFELALKIADRLDLAAACNERAEIITDRDYSMVDKLKIADKSLELYFERIKNIIKILDEHE